MSGRPTPDCRLAHWHHGRFEVNRVGCDLHFRDWLMPKARSIPASRFAGLEGRALAQAWLAVGIVPSALGAAMDDVSERPRHVDDPLFWQYPCRTEGAAWDVHVAVPEARRVGDDVHMYLGLPWATWIDKERKGAWGGVGYGLADFQLRRTKIRIAGLRDVLRTCGLNLRVHTVCQHIYWADFISQWRELGVTDLWLSHCPAPGSSRGNEAAHLHPWRLFAVNAEDPQRTAGLQIGRDPSQRPLLASFIGAHAPHYLSDIRLRIRALPRDPDVFIEVTDQWHFEAVVYDEQLLGRSPARGGDDPSVRRYNELMSDSVFSLCPSGAGANTLRLWEALASGSIPVLLGQWPQLPEPADEFTSAWEDAVIRVRDEELSGMLPRLRSISLDERRRRQRAGMRLFGLLKDRTCFDLL